jgi:hypothetical protein
MNQLQENRRRQEALRAEYDASTKGAFLRLVEEEMPLGEAIAIAEAQEAAERLLRYAENCGWLDPEPESMVQINIAGKRVA